MPLSSFAVRKMGDVQYIIYAQNYFEYSSLYSIQDSGDIKYKS